MLLEDNERSKWSAKGSLSRHSPKRNSYSLHKRSEMKRFGSPLVIFLIIVFSWMILNAQTPEIQNEIRLIHNKTGEMPGVSPKFWLSLTRTIGGINVEDTNLAFHEPRDVVVDSRSNIYILDSGDAKIQKLNSEGRFIKTIGRKGQGPVEFQLPFSIDINEAGELCVFDYGNGRIQFISPEGKMGKSINTALPSASQIRVLKSGFIAIGGMAGLPEILQRRKKSPNLLFLRDQEWKIQTSFCEAREYGDPNVDFWANELYFDLDADENICVSFKYQNRIDKYSQDGRLLWRADRTLRYGTDVIDKGSVHSTKQLFAITMPTLNTVSQGISIDGRGRVWVITLNRQLTRAEKGNVITAGGKRKIVEPLVKKMDIYKLEIFSPDGLLMAEIPLDHLAQGIRIFGDILFLWEYDNAIFYQYRIID
jgi:hypothetical protein